MAQPQPESIQFGTDYRLKAASIITGSGSAVDIRLIIDELNLYEDIFSSTMTGNIVLHDTSNLVNTLPITGFDYAVIEFAKPSSSEIYSKVFRIYKMTDRQRINAQTETYILHLCSEESILNESTRVSKSYVSQTIDAIIRDIAFSFLKINPDKFSDSHITSTSERHSIVIPNWRPFFAINWLCRMARSSSYSSPSFVFFEDRDGFHFTSIELLSQQEPTKSILISPRNLGVEQDTRESDLEITMKTAYEWEMPYGFDIVQNIDSGMYAGSLISVDPIRQRILNTDISSKKVFNNMKHLNTNSLLTDLKTRKNTTPDQDTQSFLRVYPTTLGHDTLEYGNIKGTMLPNNVEQWLIQRNMYFSTLHSSKINVSMPGDTSLRAGQVVDAKFPAYILQDQTEKELDELYSGKYIITAVRHSMNQRTHVCYLELAKESAKKSYPFANNTIPLLKKLKGL